VRGDAACLSVTDGGPRIDADLAPLLFEPVSPGQAAALPGVAEGPALPAAATAPAGPA